jgi:LysR family glycine cleavage system transcriptional activator
MQISGNAGLIDSSEEINLSMEKLFRSNDVDVVIRFGSGDYPGCIVHKLFSVEAIPLCSPALLNDPDKPLKTPQDLKYHTLLHDNTDYKGRPEWKKWLKNAGVTDVNVDRGLRFNHINLAMDAAIDGQGVLLGVEALARYDIAAGRLCQPFDLSLPLKRSYYVIQPESVDSNQHAVDAFIEWILEEAKAEPANQAG